MQKIPWLPFFSCETVSSYVALAGPDNLCKYKKSRATDIYPQYPPTSNILHNDTSISFESELEMKKSSMLVIF